MRKLIVLACLVAIASPSSIKADDEPNEYNFRQRLAEFAFNPQLFFPQRRGQPHVVVTYTGDDYGYPVYAFAIRRGCTNADKGEARKTCGKRLLARMVRSPWSDGDPERPRWRGSTLLKDISDRSVTNDGELAAALNAIGVEWLEADLAQCPSATAKLNTFNEIDFQKNSPVPSNDAFLLALHADKVTFEYGGYLSRSRHYGAAFEGTPMLWAVEFVASFEECWKPASDAAPWERRE